MHKYCFTCKHENLSVESAPCEGCFDGSASKWFPRTQADRIRAMSNEELAYFLYETETQYIPIIHSLEARPCAKKSSTI